MKKLLVLAGAAALALGAQAASSLNFRVDLDISNLVGDAPFGLQFDLSDNLASFESSTITLSNFVVQNGSFTGGTASLNPGSLVTGDFGGTLTLGANGTVGLSDAYSEFTSGVTRISFDVLAESTLQNFTSHGFSVFVFDANDFITTNAPGGANFVLNLDLNSESTFADVSVFSGSGVSAGVTAIPEPSTYGLMGAGALATVAVVRRRRKAAQAA